METILQHKEMLLYERLGAHRENCHTQISHLDNNFLICDPAK